VGYPQTSVETRDRNKELAGLIKRMAAQDQQAMAELYDATRRLVYGLVLRIVTDPAAADEALVDVYMQAWRQADRFDEQRGAPLAWLTTIARSRALDRVRAGSYDRKHSEPLDAASHHLATTGADEAAFASETQRHVRRALEALTPEQREVIELAYYGGLSHSEIALDLGQPLGTVKTRTRLGMMKLRELLRPLFSEGAL
jgi:RNA polymerase sigma-70 factor (ECF subfamily)